ncbi:MAG: DivIVA domain-containing protein [Pseudonocardiaceae bacterium]
MPLRPADVRSVTFSKPTIGKRGYHEDEVDAFLDLVQAELTRLIHENTDLRNQIAQRDQQLRAAPVDTGSNLRQVGPPGRLRVPIRPPMTEQTSSDDDHNVHAVKVLGLAQEMAERLTGEAKTEADAMLNQARATSAQLLSEARAKAEGMVTEARTRAETMLNDARARAETLDRQSREKAASLELDAARKHSEVLGSISQEKTVLEKKIDELRTFEHEYRTRLKTYLQSQLRKLDGPGPTAPTDPIHTQQDLVTSGSGARAETQT